MIPPTIKWAGDIDGHVELIDQRLLPHEIKMLNRQ